MTIHHRIYLVCGILLAIGTLAFVGHLNKRDIDHCIAAGYAVETCYAIINP